MDKFKGLFIIGIAITSVVVTAFIANLLLDTTGKVNQGNFRISDVIVKSSAVLTEVQDKELEVTKLSDIVFDISQTNDISILIESNVKATEISIENLSITNPALKGKMNICQKDYSKYDITPDLNSIKLEVEQEEGKYIINLCIDNDNVITDKSVDESVEKIQYDASIFKILNIDVNSLKFDVSFDLYIKDETGRIVKTNINLSMPTEETLTKGMSILKQDVSKYIFTIMDK